MFYFLIKKELNSTIALFSSFLLVISPTVLTYSVGLKQYSFELLYSIFLLQLSSQNKEDYSKIILKPRFYIVSFFLILVSLANFGTFLILFTICSYKYLNRTNAIKLKYFLIVPFLIFFGTRAFSKVERSSFFEYWNGFFIDVSDFNSFFDSTAFLYSLFLKNILGFTWNFYTVFLISIFFAVGLVSSLKGNYFAIAILLVFVLLNVLNLYPIGGSRTDIILLPFFIYLVALGFNKILVFNNLKIFNYILIFIIILYSHIFVKPFYKTETITPILYEISEEFNNNSDSIFVTYEQKHSFDYYGKDYFEIKNLIREDNNCSYYQLNIKNYFKFDPKKDSIYYENFQLATDNSNKVFVVGIELEGTVGVFRIIEKDLLENGFKLKKSNIYPIGVYLNVYEIINNEN